MIRVYMVEQLTLLTSLTLAAIFSLVFGDSTSFKAALVFQFLTGLSNVISGSVKRAAIV